jgi:rhodanese-related sulfurtransferase
LRRRRATTSLPLALCLTLVAAAVLGLAFNLLMPQGIGLLPPWLAAPRWQPLGLAQAAELHNKGALFVDARDPGDYKTARVRGAVSLYPSELKLLYPLLQKTLAAAPALVVYGQSTSRNPAAEVGQFLRAQGLEKVYVLSEPFWAWRAASLPLRVPRRKAKP